MYHNSCPRGIENAKIYSYISFFSGVGGLQKAHIAAFLGNSGEKSRNPRGNVAAMLLSLLGVMLLSSGSLDSDKAYIGILLAIASAVVYAAYFLWTEHQHLAAMDATVYVTLKTCYSTVFLLLYILVTNQLTFDVSFQSVLGLALSGLGTILASFCLTLAIRHIGSVYTSILGSIELIVVAIADFLFLGDRLTLRSCIGIVVVLIATILVTLSKQQKEK